MNKKDVAYIRRQFKPDNERMKIRDIFNVYIMKDSSEIYHYECQPFGMLDSDQQELFLNNFKKLLAGEMDEKLFELKFVKEAENSSQLILHQGLLAEEPQDWVEQMLFIVEKMLQDEPFEQDAVVTFIRGDYYKSARSDSGESDSGERNEVYAHRFILCSVNTTEQQPKSLAFDYVEKEFKYHVIVDPIIKLATPQAGFLFPCFSNHAADVNRVLYAADKAHAPDPHFTEYILNAEETVTSKEDKAIFEEIVREVAGSQLAASTLANMYEEIHTVIEEREDEEDDAPRLDARDVERVLKVSGVKDIDEQKVEEAFRNVIDDDKYELKAQNVMPKYTTKSIKINTKVANIAISPQDLKYVKLVHQDGKRCIMIEMDEDAVIEGFTMDVEDE